MPQLDSTLLKFEKIRHERRVEQFGFDFDEHASPSDGWFAIDESTGVPVEVAFTDPVGACAVCCW